MIEVAVEFIKAFIEKEYQALVSQYTERDEAIFQAKVAELEAYYEPDIPSMLNRPNPPDEEWFELGKQSVEQSLTPRILFQIKEYEHPSLGKLYRCYVGQNFRARNNNQAHYILNLYVAQKDGGLKIVSKYHIDRNKTTLDTGLDSWSYRDGIELETLGNLLEVRKFREPTPPEQLAEYLAE